MYVPLATSLLYPLELVEALAHDMACQLKG